jgi:hypothetical protein
MAISDSQKVDYLFKKIGYSVAKTDTSSIKSPSNESIASPLVVRGDSIWSQSDLIPAVIPTSNSSVVALYNDTIGTTVQTANDGTASANRTWLTNLTDWIDPSFGSTYQVKIYLATTGNTSPQYGTQLFADGTGSDEWFFDYASGVLNFIGTSLPSQTYTGKSIFVAGARYVGSKGVSTIVGNVDVSGNINANTIYQSGYQVLDSNTIISVNGDVVGSGTYGNIYAYLVNSGVTPGIYGSADDEYADRVPKITVDAKGRITNIANVTLTQVGNVSFNDTTISSNSSMTVTTLNNGNIVLTADGTGVVQITGGDAVGIPSGNTAARPTTVLEGYVRFNTDIDTLEWYNGTIWDSFQQGQITSQIIIPDGTSVTYTLSANASTSGVMVSINGTLQQPDTSYSVHDGDQITFVEVPLSTDEIEVRQIGFGVTSVQSLIFGEAEVVLNNNNINVKGNIIPTVDDIYDIGSPTSQWNNIYISGEVISTSANTTVSSAAVATTIDSYSKTTYRTAKYVVQAERSTDFESYEVLVTHNGTNAYRTTYGIVTTGNTLGTLTTTISGANVLLQFTATYTNTVVRLSKNYLAI